MTCLRIKSISDMIKSPLVKKVLRSWFEQSRLTETVFVPGMSVSRENTGDMTISPSAKRSLDWNRKYPTLDWPEGAHPLHDALASTASSLDANGPRRKLPSYSSEKKVPFLGGPCPFPPDESTQCQRISMLPTSYTDLYAELGALCPDSEQTAICLVCGMVSPVVSSEIFLC